MTILKCQQGCGATFDEQRAAEFGVTEGDRCPFDGGALVRVLRPAPANCEPNEAPAEFAWLQRQQITLTEVAELYPVAYSTLAEAAREGRLRARQSGATWLTTRADVDRAIATGKLRPRKRK